MVKCLESCSELIGGHFGPGTCSSEPRPDLCLCLRRNGTFAFAFAALEPLLHIAGPPTRVRHYGDDGVELLSSGQDRTLRWGQQLGF